MKTGLLLCTRPRPRSSGVPHAPLAGPFFWHLFPNEAYKKQAVEHKQPDGLLSFLCSTLLDTSEASRPDFSIRVHELGFLRSRPSRDKSNNTGVRKKGLGEERQAWSNFSDLENFENGEIVSGTMPNFWALYVNVPACRVHACAQFLNTGDPSAELFLRISKKITTTTSDSSRFFWDLSGA